MKKRLLIFLIIIILISVIGTALISSIFTINNYTEEKKEALDAYGKMIVTLMIDDSRSDSLRPMREYAETFSLETGYRITIIGEDGSVLGDSEARERYEELENHGDREEVIEALANGHGNSNRESESFGKEYLYISNLAELDTGEKIVVRLAMEINKWEIAKDQVIKSSLIAAVLGIIIAIMVVLLYTNRLMRPIRKMENDLNKALEESEKAENIRKDFVANVTHELKTPLTSISGFAETMQGDPDMEPETRMKFLDIIALESSRLSRLIDDIFIISDIESGRETNTDEDINVKRTIEEVVHALTPLADSKNINIITTFQYEMYIGGNHDRFKQMIYNLIENAIKYSDKSGDVTILCEKIDASIYIHVKDQGIGIAVENLDRLFERFYRVDKSRSQKAGGTGLGLAIVKHIATLFDAEIIVESELGKGTEFTLIFPSMPE